MEIAEIARYLGFVVEQKDDIPYSQSKITEF